MQASPPSTQAYRQIGVISDTHGLLRPEALQALKGCDLILHAGDIGRPDILEDLMAIAPILAVRGNNDHGTWAEKLPITRRLEVHSQSILLTHELSRITSLDHDPPVHMIISGHSHKPTITEQNGIIFLNPGSAGPRRFSLPIALARIICTGPTLRPELIHLLS